MYTNMVSFQASLRVGVVAGVPTSLLTSITEKLFVCHFSNTNLVGGRRNTAPAADGFVLLADFFMKSALGVETMIDFRIVAIWSTSFFALLTYQ